MDSKPQKDEMYELAIFEVGQLTCALFIKDIQEINKHIDITTVDNAPVYIRGMMNLRGTIITIIDLRAKFHMDIKHKLDNQMRILVVKMDEESIGLLVDKMLDVVSARRSAIEPPPSNIQGIAGKYFSSIYKMEGQLAAVLNIKEILSVEEAR